MRYDKFTNPNKVVIITFARNQITKGLSKPTLFSKTIQLFTEVRYLGLTSHKELIWKKLIR
jgi:hypothetical protein